MLCDYLSCNPATNHRNRDAGAIGGQDHSGGVTNEEVFTLDEGADGAGHRQGAGPVVSDLSSIPRYEILGVVVQAPALGQAPLDTEPDVRSSILREHPGVAAGCY